MSQNKKILLLNWFLSIFFILAFSYSQGQDTLFIAEGTTVSLFEKDTIAVYGPVVHAGTLGQNKGSHLIMLGEKWQNKPGSKITDGDFIEPSKDGGVIEFLQPNMLYNQTQRQWIDGAFQSSLLSGTGFSNLVVNNNNGIWLTSDMNICANIKFTTGHVYLNGNCAVMGNETDNGTISGYTEQRYFVTGTSNGGSYLFLRNLKPGVDYVFPIGEDDLPTRYDPLAIQTKLFAEDIGVSVFSETFSRGSSGILMPDSSVNTTWKIKKKKPFSNNYQISLQHNIQNEGALFKNNSQNSYIGIYQFGKWQDVSVQHSSPQTPGIITSGLPVPTGAVNSTSFEVNAIDSVYLTKFAGGIKGSALSLFVPNVITPNGDGKNDDLDIPNINNYPDNEMVIINRWGNEVFKTKSYSSSNKFSGRNLSEGTYFYILRITIPGMGTPIVYKGYITLIR